MGFDGVVAQAIMLIAVISASTLLVLAFNGQFSDSINTMAIKNEALEYQLKTDIQIEAVSYNETTGQINFYARNTGDTILKHYQVNVYVNGVFIRNNSQTREISLVEDTNIQNPNYWDPNELINGTINQTLSVGSINELSLTTQYNTVESIDFSAN
ncbi:MAG TPA: hypothetical protein VK158_04185 [Acidobacteriota bacterium]|nr:hypothetical protein [Acidobacteriota bacterium]